MITLPDFVLQLRPRYEVKRQLLFMADLSLRRPLSFHGCDRSSANLHSLIRAQSPPE